MPRISLILRILKPPCFDTLARLSPVTPLESALTKNTGGGGSLRFFPSFRPPAVPTLLESEEAGLAAGNFAVEVFVGAGSRDAAARGAVDQADLHQVGLVDFLDGVFLFAEGGGKRADADGAATVFIEQGEHEVAVDFIEAAFVDAKHGQGFLSDRASDAAGGTHFGKIAGAAQQAIGDARRSAAAASDFFGAAFVHFDGKNSGGAMQDDQQIFRLVKSEEHTSELQSHHDLVCRLLLEKKKKDEMKEKKVAKQESHRILKSVI